MKRYIIIALLFHCGLCYGQKEGVVIEDRPLVWKDFKGKPTTDVYKAKTYTYMGYESKIENKKLIYEITCVFNPKLSWVSKDYLKQCTDEASAYLLKHEQGHYDVARIIAVEADKTMGDFKYDDKRIRVQADSIFRSYVKKAKQVQDAYDKDTNHSKVTDEQIRWNDKIEKGLKEGRIDL